MGRIYRSTCLCVLTQHETKQHMSGVLELKDHDSGPW